MDEAGVKTTSAGGDGSRIVVIDIGKKQKKSAIRRLRKDAGICLLRSRKRSRTSRRKPARPVLRRLSLSLFRRRDLDGGCGKHSRGASKIVFGFEPNRSGVTHGCATRSDTCHRVEEPFLIGWRRSGLGTGAFRLV